MNALTISTPSSVSYSVAPSKAGITVVDPGTNFATNAATASVGHSAAGASYASHQS